MDNDRYVFFVLGILTGALIFSFLFTQVRSESYADKDLKCKQLIKIEKTLRGGDD